LGRGLFRRSALRERMEKFGTKINLVKGRGVSQSN
jgi:hypothetical protein